MPPWASAHKVRHEGLCGRAMLMRVLLQAPPQFPSRLLGGPMPAPLATARGVPMVAVTPAPSRATGTFGARPGAGVPRARCQAAAPAQHGATSLGEPASTAAQAAESAAASASLHGHAEALAATIEARTGAAAPREAPAAAPSANVLDRENDCAVVTAPRSGENVTGPRDCGFLVSSTDAAFVEAAGGYAAHAMRVAAVACDVSPGAPAISELSPRVGVAGGVGAVTPCTLDSSRAGEPSSTSPPDLRVQEPERDYAAVAPATIHESWSQEHHVAGMIGAMSVMLLCHIRGRHRA